LSGGGAGVVIGSVTYASGGSGSTASGLGNQPAPKAANSGNGGDGGWGAAGGAGGSGIIILIYGSPGGGLFSGATMP
jgi:endoglycosylceramidase